MRERPDGLAAQPFTGAEKAAAVAQAAAALSFSR
jgi:hypothetical protein